MAEWTGSSVSVVVVGYPRAPLLSLPALFSSLTPAAKRIGTLTGFAFHLIRSETNSAGIDRSIELLKSHSGPKSTFHIYEDNPEKLGTSAEETIANSMPNPYRRHSSQSVSNHLRLLKVMDLLKGTLSADSSIVVRADLVPVGEISFERYQPLIYSSILTPSWHRWRGVNDRFAFVPKAYTGRYLGRFSASSKQLLLGRQIHGETFLLQSLRGLPLSQCVSEKFARTTELHTIQEENFRAKATIGSVVRQRLTEAFTNL
jgi:hypothetical protein